MRHTLTPFVGVCDRGGCVAASSFAPRHTIGSHTLSPRGDERVAHLRKLCQKNSSSQISGLLVSGFSAIFEEIINYGKLHQRTV